MVDDEELRKKIEVYAEYILHDCSEPYTEISWLLEEALKSPKNENILDALEIVYNRFK
jgi:hypothetical protein